MSARDPQGNAMVWGERLEERARQEAAERLAARRLIRLVDRLITDARPSKLSRHEAVVDLATLRQLAGLRQTFSRDRLGAVLAEGIHEAVAEW